MRLKAVPNRDGLYRDETSGRYYARFKGENGKRTKRRLRGYTEAQAAAEAAFATGSADITFSQLARNWIELGCPKVSTPRPPSYHATVNKMLKWPLSLWADRPARSIRYKDADDYPAYRRGVTRKENCTGNRAADMELNVCQSLFSWAKRKELVGENPFEGRERAWKISDETHCTERAPESASVVHAIAAEMFKDTRSESTGWLWLFICITGCRQGELYNLPWGVEMVGQDPPPGFFNDACFVIRAGKQRDGGDKTRIVELHPAAREMFEAFRQWHALRHGGSPWWFPGVGDGHIGHSTLNVLLQSITQRLGLRHVSAHGGRAFACAGYRTMYPNDREVAMVLGHTTPTMVQNVYGGRMPGRITQWLPDQGEPAWRKWLSVAENVVRVA